MTPEEKTAWLSKLEGLGVSYVRGAVDKPGMWDEPRAEIARKWLSERNDASNNEQNRYARSAKNAAWIAAIAAIISAAAALWPYIK